MAADVTASLVEARLQDAQACAGAATLACDGASDHALRLVYALPITR